MGSLETPGSLGPGVTADGGSASLGEPWRPWNRVVSVVV